MLLSHFTVSGLGIIVITVWTWFIQLREKEAMSEGDEGERQVEMTSDASSQREVLLGQEGRHSSRQQNSKHVSEEGEEDELERERVIIHTDRESRGEDDDSGISEPPCSYDEHLLPGQVSEMPGSRLKRERVWDIFIQVFIPFLIAGFGMLTAGLLLDTVQHWDVYMQLNEIFILVPALLGLKGNLEMTLASRLSTAANVGHLDEWKDRWKLAWGNLALIQVQALVVAGLATLISITLGADLTGSHMLLLGASAMGSAAIASAILGSIMIVVILLSHHLRINPDNVATPIAASLGDLVTLGLLSIIARGLFVISNPLVSGLDGAVDGSGAGLTNLTSNMTTVTAATTPQHPYATVAASSTIVLVLVLLIPVWLFLAYKNSATKSVLFYGWFPVICAMCISSGGGWVLSKAVNTWKGIAVYSPIINGVGGNLVAVQASRISTSLHQTGSPGTPPSDPSQQYHGPLKTFFSSNQHSKTAKLLVGMVIPGSVIFLLVIRALNAGHTTTSAMFFVGYLICAVLQVSLLLLIADWMVHFIWKRKLDPDNVAIPFLTALGDLLGTGLLSLGFLVMWLLGDRDEDVGE